MGPFTDARDDNRFEQVFDGEGGEGRVWADYAVRGGARMILHVEADQSDVPLSFHPAATRVLGLVTPRSVG